MRSDKLNFQKRFGNCNFAQRKEKCLKLNLTTISYSLNMNEVDFFFRSAKFVLNVLFFPFFCLAGILLSLLSIVIVNNANPKLSKDLDGPMYKYMKLNSCFNAIFCFVFLFKLLTTCTSYTGIFCSSIYQTTYSQYFEIFFIQFIAKLCSNISSIFVSISRSEQFIEG